MKKAKGKNLPKDWEEKLWPKFLDCIEQSRTSNEMARLVQAFLGDLGRDHVLRRFTAILMLRDNRTYREVRDALGLSYNTIRALRNGLQKGEYVVWEKIERAYTKKKITSSDFFKKPAKGALERFLTDLLLWEIDPKVRWRFLNEE